MRSCLASADAISAARESRRSLESATNLLLNLAVGNATAHYLHDPLLNLLYFDIHVSSALVESQDGLRQHKTKPK
jgi:hypothetical protein